MPSSAFAKAATFKVPFHRTTATSYNRKLSRCRKLNDLEVVSYIETQCMYAA